MQTTTIAIAGQQFQIPTVDLMRVIVNNEERTEREERSKTIFSALESLKSIIKPDPVPAMPSLLAKIGDELQGGWYAGPMFNVETGRFEHKIAAKELVEGDHAWDDHRAANAARAYRGGGHTDWRLPTKTEGHLLQIYLQPMGKLPKRVCWTSTPFGSDGAWALVFEDGDVLTWYRGSHRAVLPVRSITA